MKSSRLVLSLACAALALSAQNAFAQTKVVFAGSDTLAGAMTDAIIASGMDQQIQYAGGGSGVGEKGLVNGDQGIAPMSREIKPEAVQQLAALGVTPVAHVVALDGISMFVKASNPIPSLDIQTVARIYTCEFSMWEQIPGSGLKGPIKVYRRNDQSGTTDAFKHFTGLKNFGACVTVLNETADISEATARDGSAIGYAGLSGKTVDNRAVAMSAKPGSPAVLPTTQTIRDFSYPMARNLYVYEATGARTANSVEATLLELITDRSFMDPIAQAHEFITID
jgi:phosphate transport system substrate-binding protein